MLALSLPSSYLGGAASDAAAALWTDLLGPPERALTHLASLGVQAIEVSDVRGAADAERVVAAMATIRAAGLRPHAHLWAPAGFDPEQPPRPLAVAVDAVSQRGAVDVQRGAACALHGHRRHDDDAYGATVAALTRLEPWLRAQGVRSALEICRFKPQGPLGGTYAEVLALVAAAEPAPGALGVTWDLGHTTWNHAQGFDAAWPPAAFLERVAHVHVHDMDDTGQTHHPLDQGRVPLQGFVERLRSVGYAGSWDLELYPERWGGEVAERRRRLDDSVARLAEAIA